MNKALFPLLLLTGCATVETDWYYDGMFHPKAVQIERVSHVEPFCGPAAAGCYRANGIGVGTIYLGPRANHCTLIHELWHFAGWKHKGPVGDCGVVFPEYVTKLPEPKYPMVTVAK
jgi:hypothetical protein